MCAEIEEKLMGQEQDVFPKYMNVKTFCRYIGLSQFQFRRIRDRQGIPAFEQGQNKFIEIEVAVKALAREPGIEAILSKQGVALLQQFTQPSSDIAPQWEPEPQDAA
jgi:hypothetical protein